MDSCGPSLIRRFGGILVLSSLLLSSALGCARLNSIHRTTSPFGNRAQILSIDAKQRNVVSAVVTDPNDKNTYRRFCSEPSPDVFTALASSITAELDGSVSAQKAQTATASLKGVMSENAATIERTQTINILREAMFRNCERYLSGALSNDEFIVQAARDQRAMVHILAIEQITGVSRAQSTALTTLAKATSSGTTEETVKILDAARQKEVDAKKASLDAAKAAHAQAPEGDCASMPKAPSDQVTEAQLKDKKAKCQAAENAAQAHKDAADHYATVVATVQRQGDALAAAWGSASAAQLQGAASNKDIAAAVLDIVRQSDNFNEVEMACVVRLRNGPRPGNDDKDFYDACKDLVTQLTLTERAKSKSEELKYNAAAVSRYQAVYQNDIANRSDILWAYFGQGSKLNAAAVDALAAKAGVPLARVDRKDLLNVKSLADMRRVVAGLTESEVSLLVEATR